MILNWFLFLSFTKSTFSLQDVLKLGVGYIVDVTPVVLGVAADVEGSVLDVHLGLG